MKSGMMVAGMCLRRLLGCAAVNMSSSLLSADGAEAEQSVATAEVILDVASKLLRL